MIRGLKFNEILFNYQTFAEAYKAATHNELNKL